MNNTVSVEDIDALLPQTQCGECGYPGCMPYAMAIKAGAATIDKCPPGGEVGVVALSQLLQIDASLFLATAKQNARLPARAVIREDDCIGCTKCIQACPVDAIIGSGKLMHTVLSDECTGCGLCVEPCPVDCIDMVLISDQETPAYDKTLARSRFNARKMRVLREQQASAARYREKRRLALDATDNHSDKLAKRDYILAAMNRVKVKKNHE